MPDGPECLFGDMSDFWQPELKSRVDTLLQNGNFVEVVKKLMQTTDVFSMVKRSGFCIKCQKQCEDPRAAYPDRGQAACWLSCRLSAKVLLHLSVGHEVKPAKLHIAGTPCTDFSPRGEMKGLAGVTTGFPLLLDIASADHAGRLCPAGKMCSRLQPALFVRP